MSSRKKVKTENVSNTRASGAITRNLSIQIQRLTDIETTENMNSNNEPESTDISLLEVEKWQQEIQDHLKKLNHLKVLEESDRVFNMKEAYFPLDLAGTVSPFLTALIVIGASGIAGPATIFFPNNELLPRNIFSDKTTGNVSELTTDYPSNDKLLSFMKLTFHPWLISKQKSFPVVVFIDINPVHISFALLSFCKECRIILLRTTSAIKLHPISSFIVPHLENEWTRALLNGNNMRGNRRIAMELIPSIFAKVLEKTITVDLLKDAFEKCGTFPFDPVTAHKQRMTSSASLQDISSSHRPVQTRRSITYPADAYLNQPTIEIIQQEVIAEPVPIEQNVVPTQAVHSTPQQTRTFHTIDQMDQFRILLGPLTYEFMNAGNSWTGAIENTSLFHVWQRLHKLYETTRPITQAAHPRAQEIDLQFLIQFEKLIGPLVFEFKKSGDVWTGAPENRSLFEVWKQLFMVDASTQTDSM